MKWEMRIAVMLQCAQVGITQVSTRLRVFIRKILNGSENLATYDVFVSGMCKKEFWIFDEHAKKASDADTALPGGR